MAGMTGGGEPHGRVAVASDIDGAVIVATVAGRWEPRLALDVDAQAGKALAERPIGLVVDVRGLVDPTAASAPTWITVHRKAVHVEPSVQVVLCLPNDAPLADRLRDLGAKRFLPSFATMPAVMAALNPHLILAEHVQRVLPPRPRSAAAARRLVAEACRAWHLPAVATRAQLVMSELVANAIEHTGTSMLITVSRRGSGVYLAVRDGNTAMPRSDPDPIGLTVERGRGLQIVEATAAAWGALPSHDGSGKVVGATVRGRGDRS